MFFSYYLREKVLRKDKVNGIIGKLEFFFFLKIVFRRLLNEFYFIYFYKLEWKDIVMKYSFLI